MRWLLLLALVGCKDKKAEAPLKASCFTPASQTCEDYDSNGPAYIKSRGKDCQQIKGTWSTSPCATANRLGSCQEKTANWTRTRHYYVGAQVVIERTKIECGAFGTWLEPTQ